ncbi:hypothetical protein [Hyphomicrobium sp.]|uniref:hypothetical protein n=1 Tax=Hyphomicrobium sp. TaxID=82 RepID=UPI001E13FE42|nr:hypothetical protein [Hyphomicrobium sp.]MBY0560058.1 hypothetical protein [Hyphomicrobium sp.]
MPKYTVRVKQYVEEVAEFEVEADNDEEAMALVKYGLEHSSIDLDWKEGNEALGLRVATLTEKKPDDPKRLN